MNRDREKARFTWVAPSSTVFFNLWTSSIKGISVSIATGLLRSEELTYIENYVENKGKQTQKNGEKDFQLHAKENESSGSEVIERTSQITVTGRLFEVPTVGWVKIKNGQIIFHGRVLEFATREGKKWTDHRQAWIIVCCAF